MCQKIHINRCFRWKRIELIWELFMAMFDYQRITHNFRITSLNQENMWIIWLLNAKYVYIICIYICNQTLRLNQPQHGDIIREVIIWYYLQIWEGRYREKHIPLWIGPRGPADPNVMSTTCDANFNNEPQFTRWSTCNENGSPNFP